VYSRGLIAEIAENALVEVVAIERICAIDLVRFRSEWDPLVLNSQQFRRVMDDAVAVVVVADRAVQHVIAQNAIECFHLGRLCLRRLREDRHSIGDWGCTGSNQSAIHFHHARVTRLNRL